MFFQVYTLVQLKYHGKIRRRIAQFPFSASVQRLLGETTPEIPRIPHAETWIRQFEVQSVTKFICRPFTELNRSADINLHDANWASHRPQGAD